MPTLRIETAPIFEPLLGDHRYKGAYGGRASAKSHFMAEYVIERALIQKGHRALCYREVQKTLKQSAKHLLETKLAKAHQVKQGMMQELLTGRIRLV